jgi:hypothetical protein
LAGSAIVRALHADPCGKHLLFCSVLIRFTEALGRKSGGRALRDMLASPEKVLSIAPALSAVDKEHARKLGIVQEEYCASSSCFFCEQGEIFACSDQVQGLLQCPRGRL